MECCFDSVQACRLNLTAGAARPNPQGSYHYGWIKVNGVISLRPSTPLKLADYLKLDGVFHVGSIPDHPIDWATRSVASSVVAGDFRAFVEIVFQNPENTLQSWHMDGYAFFVVG
jgi:iron transport multicopper oxidase